MEEVKQIIKKYKDIGATSVSIIDVAEIIKLLQKDKEQLLIDGVVKSLPNKYCPQCGEPIKKPHKFWCEDKP